MSITGKKFPNMEIAAMDYMGENQKINPFELAKKKGKKVLLFWYPKDFTFVCPTEIHAFQEVKNILEHKNTLLLGASCDTPEVHFAWLNTPKDQGGIEGVTFPILSDTNRNLARTLNILDSEPNPENENHLMGDDVSYRATYLIDENGEVFHESINHMPLGRNVQEYIRLIDAYTHVQTNGEVCPANWDSSKDALVADRAGIANYLKQH